MNVVNFSDGVDGLAAGICAISAVAFSVIAFDLDRGHAGVLAAITAGAAAGFLVHNLPPRARAHGRLRAPTCSGCCWARSPSRAPSRRRPSSPCSFPLVVLAVPFLDTTFVVLKRMKYGRPVYRGDANHFHHRFSRIGFSQRRTVAYLYAWTVCLAAFALALRFVPYSDQGDLDLGWSLVMGGARSRSCSPRASTSSTFSRSSSSAASTRCACAARARTPPMRRSTPTWPGAWRRGSSRR